MQSGSYCIFGLVESRLLFYRHSRELRTSLGALVASMVARGPRACHRHGALVAALQRLAANRLPFFLCLRDTHELRLFTRIPV